MNILEYKEFIDKMNDYETAHAKAIEDFLKEILETFELKAFAWQGYTPSFNDGDPCEYSGGVADFFEYLEDEDEEFQGVIKAWRNQTQEQRNVAESLNFLEDIFKRYDSYGHRFFAWIDEGGKVHAKTADYECGY